RTPCRPSTVLTSACPSRMTMNPTPSVPRRTGLASFGCRTSRICFPSFFRSPSDIPANRPTGFRSIARDSIRLKQVRQVAAQELWPRRLRIWRHELPQALERQAGQARRLVAGGRDGLADEHLQRLTEPDVLGAGKTDRHDRNACFDREVGKALVKRNEL